MATPDDSLTRYAVELVTLGIVSVAGFLLRQAFADLKASVASLATKMDELSKAVHAGNTANAVMEARVTRLEDDVAELREALRDASEGVVR
jgi:outer membrane murein-binding lipoprotein Lpp